MKKNKQVLKISTKYLLTASLVVLTAAMVVKPFSNAQAQIIVTDPGNTAQGILTAMQTLQSNINEAQQLAYQLQNLQKLNYTSTSEYSSKYSAFTSQIQNLQGTLNNVTSAISNFQSQYPSNPSFSSNEELLSNLNNWKTQLNNSMNDSVGTNAAVLNSIPATQSNMDNLINASNNAQGSLEAHQAGNQMLGTISGQLSQMNSQMAVYQTAQMNSLAKDEAQRAAYMAEIKRIRGDLPPDPVTPTIIPGNGTR